LWVILLSMSMSMSITQMRAGAGRVLQALLAAAEVGSSAQAADGVPVPHGQERAL